jgi:hypothetical protein
MIYPFSPFSRFGCVGGGGVCGFLVLSLVSCRWWSLPVWGWLLVVGVVVWELHSGREHLASRIGMISSGLPLGGLWGLFWCVVLAAISFC